jgi:hypothetical protein
VKDNASHNLAKDILFKLSEKPIFYIIRFVIRGYFINQDREKLNASG